MVAAIDVERAARITVAVVPALLLGYCAGRMHREPSPDLDGEVSELELVRDADRPVTRDPDREESAYPYADFGSERP